MTKFLLFALLCVITVVVLIFAPLITILAINTLLPLAIPYSFGTWAAMVWVNLTILGGANHITQTLKK